jgi:hypothetical protein
MAGAFSPPRASIRAGWPAVTPIGTAPRLPAAFDTTASALRSLG